MKPAGHRAHARGQRIRYPDSWESVIVRLQDVPTQTVAFWTHLAQTIPVQTRFNRIENRCISLLRLPSAHRPWSAASLCERHPRPCTNGLRQVEDQRDRFVSLDGQVQSVWTGVAARLDRPVSEPTANCSNDHTRAGREPLQPVIEIVTSREFAGWSLHRAALCARR